MKNICFYILFFAIGSTSFGLAQEKVSYVSKSEKEFFSNFETSSYQDLPSFLQLSISTTQENQLKQFYLIHKSELDKKIKDRDSNKKKAETIFKYLHEKVLIRYDLNAKVDDLLNYSTYNCVTATSFFISMAEEFGIPFTIYETPAHVYASIEYRNNEIIVELTAPEEGFDFGSNMDDVLQTLVNSKLISRDDLAERGPEQLFQEYIAETTPISKQQLLGIHYYNDALIQSNNSKFDSAYDQMYKALMLYKNPTFSEGFKYIVTISQLDFTLNASNKYHLLNKLLLSTKEDSVLTYTLVNHLGELIEDLLKFEENFELTSALLSDVEKGVVRDSFIDQKLIDYKVYMYTLFAQNSSLKGESLEAKTNIEKALELEPNNSRLVTYYVSVTSSYASKLSQLGLFESSKKMINELASEFPEGYPVIDDTRVQIILDALVPIDITLENASKLLPELETARSIQPNNIYLKSFSATIFHELAMQQIRRSEYEEAKKLILNGLDYSPSDATLISDLELINKILK
jgi:hypothetical protein